MRTIESGLMVFPKTREDIRVMNEIIENSDFYAEYNSESGCFIFPEEEEGYDELESELIELFSDVNHRIEGIFK